MLMNKIFTLLSAAAIAMSASAVELTVTPHEGILLSDGNVLFNEPDPDWLQDGEVWITGLVTVDADQTVAVDTKVTLTSGFEKYGICFDNCVPVAVGSSITNSSTISPGNPLEISVEPIMTSEPWTEDVIRTYVADVEIKAGGSLLKSFSIIVSNDPNASVRNVVADKEAFTVSGRYISWNLSEAPGLLSVYTADGRLVDRKMLSTPVGSTSLVLPAGLYIWATPGHSGKILLRD